MRHKPPHPSLTYAGRDLHYGKGRLPFRNPCRPLPHVATTHPHSPRPVRTVTYQAVQGRLETWRAGRRSHSRPRRLARRARLNPLRRLHSTPGGQPPAASFSPSRTENAHSDTCPAPPPFFSLTRSRREGILSPQWAAAPIEILSLSFIHQHTCDETFAFTLMTSISDRPKLIRAHLLGRTEPPRVSWRPGGVSQTVRVCSVS